MDEWPSYRLSAGAGAARPDGNTCKGPTEAVGPATAAYMKSFGIQSGKLCPGIREGHPFL